VVEYDLVKGSFIMARTLWEEVYIAGRDYIEKLKEPDMDQSSIEASGRDYVSILDRLIETQVELAEVIGASQPLPPMTWEAVKAASEGQKQVVEILEGGRRKATRSIRAGDVSTAVASLDSLTAAWRSIAPWDYERVVSKTELTVDKDEIERLKRVAVDAFRKAAETSMDRNDMARVLGCLNEGGQAREIYDSKFIWLLGANGQSQGFVERRVIDLLRTVDIVEGELRNVQYPAGGHQLIHHSLSETGRKYVDRFGTYGEGEDYWIDLDELRQSVAKLEQG
jgi:hypothetical protein